MTNCIPLVSVMQTSCRHAHRHSALPQTMHRAVPDPVGSYVWLPKRGPNVLSSRTRRILLFISGMDGWQVFLCLVESCSKKFSSAADRKRHLLDAHRFPKGLSLDTMHLRQRRPQPGGRRVPPPADGRGALPQARGRGSQSQQCVQHDIAPPAMPPPVRAVCLADADPLGERQGLVERGAVGDPTGPSSNRAGEAMDVDGEVAAAMSGLSMAPRGGASGGVSFGRHGRGRVQFAHRRRHGRARES
jgi:hypothetical protein